MNPAVEYVEAPDLRSDLRNTALTLLREGDVLSAEEVKSRGWSVALVLNDFSNDSELISGLCIEELKTNSDRLYGVITEGLFHSDPIERKDKYMSCVFDPKAIEEMAESLSPMDSIYFTKRLDFCVYAHHEPYIVISGPTDKIERILRSSLKSVNELFLKAIDGSVMQEYYLAVAKDYIG